MIVAEWTEYLVMLDVTVHCYTPYEQCSTGSVYTATNYLILKISDTAPWENGVFMVNLVYCELTTNWPLYILRIGGSIKLHTGKGSKGAVWLKYNFTVPWNVRSRTSAWYQLHVEAMRRNLILPEPPWGVVWNAALLSSFCAGCECTFVLHVSCPV
jgi:hypothetical protein